MAKDLTLKALADPALTNPYEESENQWHRAIAILLDEAIERDDRAWGMVEALLLNAIDDPEITAAYRLLQEAWA